MSPVTDRTKSALLWGVVSGLAFLVLLQAYHLAGGELVSVPVAAGATLVAAVGGGVLAAVAERWLARRTADRETRGRTE